MSTIPSFELEMRRGIELALRGELKAAAEVLARSRELNPDALDPALNLFEVYQKHGRQLDAERLGAELLHRWPQEQPVLVAVARFREWQGDPVAALALIRSEHVDVQASSLAYPDYLRLLVANGRFEEAVLESRRGRQSLYRPDALLAMALGLLYFGETDQAHKTLEGFDPGEFGDLLEEWRRRLDRSGGIDRVRPLLEKVLHTSPGEEKWRALHRAFGG